MVGFTPRSARMSSESLIDFLNRTFSEFDKLAEKHGLEKIKPIGDAYMVAAGVRESNEDPVGSVANTEANNIGWGIKWGIFQFKET